MCITNPQVLPLERITAFKVMLKVKGGYRPIFKAGAYDERIFKIGQEYYKQERLGFHTSQSLDGAIDVLNNVIRWNKSNEVVEHPENLRIVVVELRGNLVFGKDFICRTIPPQLCGDYMTILGVWKGRKS